jgi:major membrane immunogen (membrane-anchored lipoprotein)
MPHDRAHRTPLKAAVEAETDLTPRAHAQHPLLTLQRTVGNRALQKLIAPPVLPLVQRVGTDDENSEVEDDVEEEEEVEEEEVEEEEEESSQESENFEDDPSFVFKGSSGNKTYRSGYSFYDTKGFSTRQKLTELQTGKDGKLHTEFGGTGTIIPTDKHGNEVRKHKTEGAKNRQPDIDHMEDFLVEDQAIEEVEQVEGLKEPMSPATFEEFHNFVYNEPENLQIKKHSEHKDKGTTRRDKLDQKRVDKRKPYIRKQREAFMGLRKKVKGSLSDRKNKTGVRGYIYEHNEKKFDELYKKYHKDDKDDGKGGGDGLTA